MIILGIETSCDETALSIIETRMEGGQWECRVISSLIHSQAALHSAYGGVFPTLAKREHGIHLVPLLQKLLNESAAALREMSSKHTRSAPTTVSDFNSKLKALISEYERQNPDLADSLKTATFLAESPAIDRIAVTEGPGLEPTLWVGINFARTLGALWNIPVIPVNHMEGHIVGSLLQSDSPTGNWQKLSSLPSPAIALLVSGGHTELVKIETSSGNRFNYKIIGETKDDAAGEAFDKAARLLGLPYPGGPHISEWSHKAYEEGIGSPVKLPRPMIRSGDLNFSFAGLKTALLYAVRDLGAQLNDTQKKGLAHEFEMAVVETLESKLRAAVIEISAKAIVIGGGVSANHVLRKRFKSLAEEYDIPLFTPTQHISGDNALMIALAASLHIHEPIREIVAEGTKRLQ